MNDQWKEKLRCSQCLSTGMVSLSQAQGTYIPVVESMPDGFKTVENEYGINFECRTCSLPVEP
jgi:hypothetical protein